MGVLVIYNPTAAIIDAVSYQYRYCSYDRAIPLNGFICYYCTLIVTILLFLSSFIKNHHGIFDFLQILNLFICDIFEHIFC